MKLEEIRSIKGTILLVTGLHIGASKESIEIGGVDQPIIKNPLLGNNAPYIPGSSLKGKLRSLIEMEQELFDDGKPCKCAKRTCPVCPVFGVSGSADLDNNDPMNGQTRIIVRDSFMTEKWQERFDNGELPMELKYENTIDRIRGTAMHPRPLERIPAGVEFDFNISFRIFENDSEQYLKSLYHSMYLLELDYLGGCGTRGSGQIKFQGCKENGKEEKPITLNNYSQIEPIEKKK